MTLFKAFMKLSARAWRAGVMKVRPALAEPANGAIFFAGEACHQGVNPCLHGAMETGVEAAERCLKRLPARSRL